MLVINMHLPLALGREVFSDNIKTMKTHLSIILLSLLLLTAGCGQKSRDGGLPVIDVVGNLGTYRQIPMSELIEDVEYIPLETAPNFLIGRHDHVRVTTDYILVGSFNYCYVFTREGKFISNIGHVGRGPGEYGMIAGVAVDEERIYINDLYASILEYSWEGKYVRAIGKPTVHEGEYYQARAGNIFPLGNDLFLGHIENDSGEEPHNWIIFDATGAIVKAFDNHIRINKDSFTSSVFASSIPVMMSGNIYVKERYNDTLYRLDRHRDHEPVFVFDIGKYTFPHDVHLTFNGMDELQVQTISVNLNHVYNMTFSPDNIFFHLTIYEGTGIRTPQGNNIKEFIMGQEIEGNDSCNVLGLYDIGSGKTELLDRDPVTRLIGLVNDLDGGLSFWPKYYNESEKVLVDVWNAYEMKEILTEEYFATHPARDPAAHARLRELLANLKEMDNPVIVIAKIK